MNSPFNDVDVLFFVFVITSYERKPPQSRHFMTIFPLPAFQDNYIWILKDAKSSEIWAVDPGDASVVLQYCREQDVLLKGILITHHHKDHTGGVAELKHFAGCPVYGPTHLTELVTHPLTKGDTVTIFSHTFKVLETPGHTLDHLCYFSSQETPRLFSGDTLFKGGCGRIMEGNPAQMLDAMTIISALPDHTLIYATHEYTLANYRFALSLEPNNAELVAENERSQQKRRNNEPTLPTRLALEKNTNPFLRTHIEALKTSAAQQLNESPANDPVESFRQVRSAKDSFS